MKTFTVVRCLQGKRGGLSVPVVSVSSEEAAKDSVNRRQHEFAQLMEFPIIRPTGQDSGEPVMTVKQFLNLIGIENVGHFIDETDVREGELIAQPKLIVQ